MSLQSILTEKIKEAVYAVFNEPIDDKLIQLQQTKKEFEGDITLVVFPLLRISKKSPEQTASMLGEYLAAKFSTVAGYNVIKGFLNLTIADSYYLDFLDNAASSDSYGQIPLTPDAELFMVEYSSPNTNKPLHLGHIRNNLLGWSICKILEANGKKVVKTNIVNDRGIHICKSMLAWQRWGNNVTPQSTGKKGDHLVGDYYVKFDQEYKKQISSLIEQGQAQEEASKNAPLIQEAQEMLRKWEAGDPATLQLWKTMNGWVYEGFDLTYKRLGVSFDRIYYESDTFAVGRDTVISGVENGVFVRRPDTSVWADLSAEKLDPKILLRSDGTSVYMTQDIGTAQLRQHDYKFDRMIYVVGNEQNHHFKVLSIVLDKLGFAWAKNLYHLSYGMVELPEGKMKSREGTVVDADDLMDEMILTAKEMAGELGKLEGLTDTEKEDIYRIIGLGALKYFILKVDPVKNMTFNPKESIDFNGNTGPFIQYTYARIRSVLRKADEMGISGSVAAGMDSLNDKEKSLVKIIHEYPAVVRDAAQAYNPSLIANFVFELAKEFNQFYHECSILKEEDIARCDFRVELSRVCGKVIRNAMELLGIEVPERM